MHGTDTMHLEFFSEGFILIQLAVCQV